MARQELTGETGEKDLEKAEIVGWLAGWLVGWLAGWPIPVQPSFVDDFPFGYVGCWVVLDLPPLPRG